MSDPKLSAYPNSGAATIADGQILTTTKKGTVLVVKTADQEFRIRLNDNNEFPVEQGSSFKFKEPFEKIEIINNSGTNLTFQLLIGGEEVIPNNRIAGEVQTNDDVAHTKLDTLDNSVTTFKTDLEALLKAGDEAQSLITDLRDCTQNTASNATVELISAVSNTNGYLIKMAQGYGTNGACDLIVDGVNWMTFYRQDNVNSNAFSEPIKNLVIESGVRIQIRSSSATSTGIANGKAL